MGPTTCFSEEVSGVALTPLVLRVVLVDPHVCHLRLPLEWKVLSVTDIPHRSSVALGVEGVGYPRVVAVVDPETLGLLWQLVDAAQSVTRSHPAKFMVVGTWGGNTLRHPGLPAGSISDFDESDLRDLIEGGLLRITNGDETLKTFELRREAFDAYDHAHRDADAPVAAQERLVVERVSSDAFAARHREASARWRDAEALLWDDDSVRNLTTIGHLCREAMQLFVTRLIELHNVTGVEEDDPARTINRLHAVIDARKAGISSRTVALLDALVDYWKAVNGLVQRQEHGEQKGGEDLTWEDGRRVVLYTAMVMIECDGALS